MNFQRGDIIALDFSPTVGHEQSGYRPALVVSGDLYNRKTGHVVVCPITSKAKPFPMRVALGDEVKTTGFVICEQVRTIDVDARQPRLIEKLSGRLLDQILDVVVSIFEE